MSRDRARRRDRAVVYAGSQGEAPVPAVPGRATGVATRATITPGLVARAIDRAAAALDQVRDVDVPLLRDATGAGIALDADRRLVVRTRLRIVEESMRIACGAGLAEHADTLARMQRERATVRAEANELLARADQQAAARAAWDADVAAMAPQLGLAGVEVRADEAARSITDAAGARGVALDGRVHLHPDRVQPGTPEGRGVLAHELIHLAQARLGVEEDRDAAEDEAAALAPLVATGSSVRPRLAIDLGTPAADNHARRDRTHEPAPATSAAPNSSSLGSLAASKHKLKLPRTVVGERAAPRAVRIYNTGETATELGDLRAIDPRTARIFPVHAAALEPIPPGGFVEIQIGFHPETTKIVSGDYQILDGDGAVADTIHVVGQGESLERAAARAVHDGDDVRVETYAELEAALAASVRLAGSENADDRKQAYELADAVVHRLDAIADHVHRAAGDYGVASTTMVTSWGFGTTAVKTWWRGLRADLRPATGDAMLVSFGAIREIVQLGTKELADSKTLEALDSPGVTIAATALPLLAAVAAPAAIEAAPELIPWMLNNPNTALAVVDTSVALIPQVVDAGGPVEYAKAVFKDPSKLVDLAMAMVQLRQGRGADVAIGGDEAAGARPKAAVPVDGVVDDGPATTTTGAKPVATGDVDAVHPQADVADAAAKAGVKVEGLDGTQREPSGGRKAYGTSEGTATRAPQPGEEAHEYQFNKMRPGPLTKDTMVVDDLNKGPASGFYGGQYDEIVLDQPAVLYRVATEREGKAGRGGLGRWFTESPLESDIQLQTDAAVRPVWPDKDGRIGNARSPAEISMTVRVPAGTKVYRGPVASQGDGFVGGPDKIQLYIPGIRDQPGVEILVVEPFVRDGHVQPSPITD